VLLAFSASRVGLPQRKLTLKVFMAHHHVVCLILFCCAVVGVFVFIVTENVFTTALQVCMSIGPEMAFVGEEIWFPSSRRCFKLRSYSVDTKVPVIRTTQ
jgi:hypothetical protein